MNCTYRRILLLLVVCVSLLVAGGALADAGVGTLASPYVTPLTQTEPNSLSAQAQVELDHAANGADEYLFVGHRPIWRTLLLVYKHIDAPYQDGNGVPQRLVADLPASDVRQAVASYSEYAATAYHLSEGEALIQTDVVIVDRPLASVTHLGSTWGYWPSPADTRQELDMFAPPGRYDSVMILWTPLNCDTGQKMPANALGLALGAHSFTNGATYAAVRLMWRGYFRDPRWTQSVWLHEWLHGVCDYYQGLGWRMPAGDADGAGSHGYEPGTSEWGEWASYYHDLMTGQVLDDGELTGILASAWRSGSILGNRAQLMLDFFNTDTTAHYATQGTVSWQAEERNVRLGSEHAADNRMSIDAPRGSFEARGRVYVPAEVRGPYAWDSVSLAVEGGDDALWATLFYGPDLYEFGHVGIIHNDRNIALHPANLDDGWHNVVVSIDYSSHLLRMKAWPEGANDPGWQSSFPLRPDWRADRVGYRHYGRGTFVDRLLVVETSPAAGVYIPLVAADWALDGSTVSQSLRNWQGYQVLTWR